MRLLETVAPRIWKLRADSNVYLLDFPEPIVIDTGSRSEQDTLVRFLDKVRPLDQVKHVIFTHLHSDHIGNFDLFKNARFYASEAEIASLRRDPEGTVLDRNLAEKFTVPLESAIDIDGLEIVQTPGHTVGSICVWYPTDKILFSGDTLFTNKRTGRLDLPTSVPAGMQQSIMRLVDYNWKILCPGHD
jgi:hydroxyacylglutathione hydrolase